MITVYKKMNFIALYFGLFLTLTPRTSFLQPFTQPVLLPPTTFSPLSNKDIINNDKKCNDMSCLALFNNCKTTSTCPEICTINDSSSSLTIIDMACGLLYQVNTETGKLKSIYNIGRTSSLKKLLYAEKNWFIWIDEKHINIYSLMSHIHRLYSFRSSFLFVAYDNCNDDIYAIDGKNNLVNEHTIYNSIPSPANIADATIDFDNDFLYIARRQNGIQIEKTSLITWNFSIVIHLNDLNDRNIILKVNPIENQLYVSAAKILVIINTTNNVKLFNINTCCSITSFDYDNIYFYFSCQENKHIRKINRNNYEDTTLTKDFFSLPPLIYKTTVTEKKCNNQTTTNSTEGHKCKNYTCPNLYQNCQTPTNCPFLCLPSGRTTEDSLKLTIIDVACGNLHFVHTKFGTIENVYKFTNISQSYQLMYSDIGNIVWIEDGNTINRFSFTDNDPRRNNAASIRIFVEYDGCTEELYTIGVTNQLIIIKDQKTIPLGRISLPINIVDAAIDFKNRLLYIARSQNGIQIQRANIDTLIFSDVCSLKDFNGEKIIVNVNPNENQLYVLSDYMLAIIDTSTTIITTINITCVIESFDYDDLNFFFTCKEYKNIFKINRTSYAISNLTRELFSRPPVIFKFEEGNKKSCNMQPTTTALEGIILPFWAIPVAVGGGVALLLLITIIIIACLCFIYRYKHNSRPPLPPDFSGLRISDKMTEDNYYANLELEVFEDMEQPNTENTNQTPALPALRSESIYADLVAPYQNIDTHIIRQDSNAAEMTETTYL